MEKEKYLSNPCRTLSIPFWKAKTVSVPDTLKIVHNADFQEALLSDYRDEPYFRLMHRKDNVTDFALPEGFTICVPSVEACVTHINQCYEAPCMTEQELYAYTIRPVFCPELWVAVKEDRSGKIVASGIGELDREISEGILEWIQVSQNYRGKGLGSWIVQELLRRMKGKVQFATVSGQCNNPTNPEGLYRKCGFVGSDIWHIMMKR